ncbi:MAG: ribosome small subunit-dependent GTPase A [Microthrixaceae bacterium]|nr:ribosome small subunit-dependent GTPase A [Microthrixaceae bacterium]
MTAADRLVSIGWNDDVADRISTLPTRSATDNTLTAGRIVRVDRGEVDVALGSHPDDVVRATTTTAAKDCVAGDWVAVDLEQARVEAVAARLTAFVRRAARGSFAPQTLAANMDVVLVVQALDPGLNLRRLERELVLAHQSGATPVVVITKTDLVDADTVAEALDQARRTAASVEVVAVSNRTGEGFDCLHQIVGPGRTFALLGSSGVGKSTLVNTFAGEEVQLEGEIREGDGKGRHTTTAARLIMLSDGRLLLDTPGVRALALWESWDGLALTFPEIEDLTSECGFADCFHDDEPNCAVVEAVEAGTIDADRLDSWRRMRDEMAELDAHLTEQQRKRDRLADRRR